MKGERRILVHRDVWVKDGPISPESLMLLASEGWTVWKATPYGAERREKARYTHYDMVKEI